MSHELFVKKKADNRVQTGLYAVWARLKCSSLLLLIIATFPISAYSDINVSVPVVVDTFYDLSGLDVQIQQVPIAIRHGFDSVGPSDEDPIAGLTSAAIGSALDSAFDPVFLRRLLIQSLSDMMSEHDKRELLEWYTSTDGIRIVAAESAHAAMVEPAQRRAFYASLKDKPPDPVRVALLESIRDAWAMTRQAVDLMIDMQIAVSIAVLHDSAARRETLLLTLREHFEQQRVPLEFQYEAENLYAALYIYQAVPDNVLERYRDFLISEVGSRYVIAVNEGMRHAMLKGSLRLGASMAVMRENDRQRKAL